MLSIAPSAGVDVGRSCRERARWFDQRQRPPRARRFRAARRRTASTRRRANTKRSRDTKARVRRGDVLVVVRLDRLARSLSHPLSVIAELDAKGAHFKSLADSIDTTTPQSRFASQVLGAVSGTRARADTGAHQGRAAPRQKTRPRRRQSQTARRRSRRHQANCRRESPSLFRARQPDRRTLAADRQRNAPRSTRWQDVVRVLNAKRDRSNGPPQPLWSVERLKRQGSELKLTAVNGLANA